MPGRLLPEPAPRLSCCRPSRRPFPSGWALAHAPWCRLPERRGQKLDRLELAELGGKPPELRSLTPAEADELKPTGSLALRTWLAHPVACECAACAYTNRALDGDDDERGFGS
jgi:hypothetical protein